jgi:hypothetical protein
MTTPFPFETASAWDRIALAGIAFSGLARVENVTRERKVDVPKRSGSDGAHLVLKRRELSKPKITLVGWTEAHLEEMGRIARACFPLERTEQHNAVTVEHPLFTFHGIDRVFVHELEGPDPQSNGTFELVLSTHQWRPPPARNASRRPTTSTPIETRATAFQRVEQPAPTPPSQTATPRRRTP